MVQGQVFLKGEGGGGHFSYLEGFSFLHLKITLCKIVSSIWRKIIFSATIILWKKV